MKTDCPDCGEPIQIASSAKVGDRLLCQECGIEFEVVSLSPRELDYTLYDDWNNADWDDEEWDEDFEKK